MINYNKSSIYKICCNDLNIKDIYIGSTTNFTRRKQQHKTRCNNINDKRHNLKLYKCIRDNGGWDNWSMILIENVSCESKLELHKIERDYIEKNNSVLNCQIPSRTKKEYNNDTKEKMKEHYKQYRDDNKENDRIYKKLIKKYYEANKERLKEYQMKYKQDNKEYYKNIVKRIDIRDMHGMKKNKEKILEKSKQEKISCECGSL